MESINQQSFLQNADAVQIGLSLPKQVSNKNYLVKQTLPLNRILSANKKTLALQEISWATATKAILASAGVLGLSYLSYQYLGRKPIPSPSILSNISFGDLLGTTIKVGGSLGLLTLIYSFLGKKEPFKSLSNRPLDIQNNEKFLVEGMIERFEIAENEFAKNINEFTEVCEAIILYFDSPFFPENFINNFLASIKEKLTNPDDRISNHLGFSKMINNLFSILLKINPEALEIAKTCVKMENIGNDKSYLFKSSESIIETALNSRIGFDLVVACVKEKNILRCEEVAKKAAVIYFIKNDFRFDKLIKEIALADNENLLKSILEYEEKDKAKACSKIENIFNIIIKAKNYKMATTLLQKCVATENKKLQDLAEVIFYVHKVSLQEASPDAAKQLSDHFEELNNKFFEELDDKFSEEFEQKSTDDDFDDFTENETKKYLNSRKAQNFFLDG